MPAIASTLKIDEAFARQHAHWLAEIERLAGDEATLREGGGARAQARQREQGKMAARERVAALCDPGSPFLEIGLWAAYGMYAEWGGAPGGRPTIAQMRFTTCPRVTGSRGPKRPSG